MSLIVNRRDLDFMFYEALDLPSAILTMTEKRWMPC